MVIIDMAISETISAVIILSRYLNTKIQIILMQRFKE